MQLDVLFSGTIIVTELLAVVLCRYRIGKENYTEKQPDFRVAKYAEIVEKSKLTSIAVTEKRFLPSDIIQNEITPNKENEEMEPLTERPLNAIEIHEFVEALEKQGLTPKLARLVKKDEDLAKKNG